MALFLFEPDKEVQVFNTTADKAKHLNEAEPMSYVYITGNDEWRIRDPKSGNWITFMHAGVPEIYRAQMLLLVAAYPD